MSQNKKVLGHKLQDYFRYWNRETSKLELFLFIALLFVTMFSPIIIVVVAVLSWFYALAKMKAINIAREIENDRLSESDHLEGETLRLDTSDERYLAHELEHKEHGTKRLSRAEWDLADAENFVKAYVVRTRHMR